MGVVDEAGGFKHCGVALNDTETCWQMNPIALDPGSPALKWNQNQTGNSHGIWLNMSICTVERKQFDTGAVDISEQFSNNL